MHVSEFEQVSNWTDSDHSVFRIEKEFKKNVDTTPRKEGKLPVSVCLTINDFLAPTMWPEMRHRVPEGGPVTYPHFGGGGAAKFLIKVDDVCVGGPDQSVSDQQFGKPGTTEQQAQELNDASIAAQLQKDGCEAHESASAPAMSGQGSLRSRTDEEMKLLLKHYRCHTLFANQGRMDSIIASLTASYWRCKT